MSAGGVRIGGCGARAGGAAARDCVSREARQRVQTLRRLLEHEVVRETQHVVEVVPEEGVRQADVHLVVESCIHVPNSQPGTARGLRVAT